MNSLWDIRIFLGLVPKESHCTSSVITVVVCTAFVCSAIPFYCQLILRNAVWCDIPRNIGWHTSTVAFSTLEVLSCFWRNTHGTAFSYIALASVLWLVDGACLPCLAVKTLSGVALFVVTHSVPCKPADYRYSSSDSLYLSVQCEVCVKNIFCALVNITDTLSRNVLSFDECASDSIIIQVPWSLVCNVYPV